MEAQWRMFAIIILIAAYFGCLRFCFQKTDERLTFIFTYLSIYILLVYIFGFGKEEWDGTIFLFLASLAPSLLVAYLLYPFKMIKRNKRVIWGLLIASGIVIFGIGFLLIWHSFSNM